MAKYRVIETIFHNPLSANEADKWETTNLAWEGENLSECPGSITGCWDTGDSIITRSLEVL